MSNQILTTLQNAVTEHPDLFDLPDCPGQIVDRLKAAGVDNRSVYIFENSITQFDLYHRLQYADPDKRKDVISSTAEKMANEMSIQKQTIQDVITNLLLLIEWQEYQNSGSLDNLGDEFVRQLAEQGDENAQLQYGKRCYELKIAGTTKESQYQEAMRWLLPLAQKGNADAQYYCGMMLFFGYGTERKCDEGFAYFNQAAEAGHGEALNRIGRIYNLGDADAGITKNTSKAKEYYERSSKTGFADSFANLAIIYAECAEYHNPELAIQYSKKAIELGSAMAANNLGAWYQFGNVGPIDLDKAVYYYTIAAKNGIAAAQRCLGHIYGWNKQFQNFDLSKFWTEKAAEQGDTIALSNMGVIYEEGRGVTANPATAMIYYQQAAEKGQAGAQCAMGRLSEKCSKYEQAKYWYEKAGKQKNATALNNLGVLYGSGRLGEKDYPKAHAYCKLAAEAGSEIAKKNMQIYYDAFMQQCKTSAQNFNTVHCPKCKGTQITSKTKGFSFGKALAGTALFGQVGALGGTIGSNKNRLVCSHCGYEWTPNSIASSITEIINN